ncbi:MAG: IS630 family transposase [Cyanobacteria bacterium P01_H01_bin.162]
MAKRSRRSGLREKKTYGYRERDATQRQVFLQQLAVHRSSQIVYLDEAGVDDTEDYPYGYCLESERFHALKLGHRTERISMVAAWCDRQALAPMTFQGHCNTALFEAWVEQFLIPDLAPGQVVVMDNASFHKSQRTQEMIEQAGCQVLLLPPCSPDFNKIEKFWARLKHHLRKTLKEFASLWDAVDDAFRKLS